MNATTFLMFFPLLVAERAADPPGEARSVSSRWLEIS
jgi:hypothetical protein